MVSKFHMRTWALLSPHMEFTDPINHIKPTSNPVTNNILICKRFDVEQWFPTGNLQKVGSCLDKYWAMKKILAPGCETATIAKLMAASRPFAYGMCMAGAGGGGFLYVLTKDANHKHLLMDILNTVEVNWFFVLFH